MIILNILGRIRVNERGGWGKVNINYKRSISFLQTLIKNNTMNPPGNEDKLAQLISKYAEKHSLETKIQSITENRSNIVIKLEGKNPEQAPLVFSGHLDTVPAGDEGNWINSPISGELIDNKIYGRGSCDMKSGLSAILEAMIFMKETNTLPETDIIFIGTAGEEVDCIGARKVIENKEISNAGAIVIAEPSTNKVFSAHKGALWVGVEIYGKTAHSSTPSEGINAIMYMVDFLKRIKETDFTNALSHKLLGETTFNISTIQGGVQTNVVPDKCRIEIDFRTTSKTQNKNIIKMIKSILIEMEQELDYFKSDVTILHDLPPVINKDNDKFVKLALSLNEDLQEGGGVEKGASYYTDGSVFSENLDIPIIIYGPGEEKLAHQPNEYV